MVTFLMIWSSGESIWFPCILPRCVGDLEVESGKIQGPSCLSSRQLARFLEDLKVLVVREDVDGMGGTFEVMSPFFQGLDDG